MKNVLFIVYYFPPMGGSGVQRPLKFIKYLRDYGWNPIVICPEPGAYQFFDSSLEAELKMIDPEIIRIKANTPFHKFGGTQRKTGLISGKVAKILRSISTKIYFPDNKKGWIKPAVEMGLNIIKEKDIKLIFSTAPPFSNHIIAQKLADKTGIPYIVDYRDLFVGNHFNANANAKYQSKKNDVERKWLMKSSGVTVLDKFAKKHLNKVYKSLELNYKIIPHGYDHQDFINPQKSIIDYKEKKLNFMYSGLFYEENQPDIFLKGLKKAFLKIPDLRNCMHLHFQGGIDKRIQKLIKELGIEANVTTYGYVNHDLSISNLLKADVLWMISNFAENLKQIKSGKLFEYIGTKKPILGLLHDGAATELLNKYGAGFTASPTDENAVSKQIEVIFQLWKSGNLPSGNQDIIKEFDRNKITSELALFFDEITAEISIGNS